MSIRQLRILSIGLDRDLLSRGAMTEAQARQLIYCRGLPARIVPVVKAPHGSSRSPIGIDPDLSVVPCPVRHWAQFAPAAAHRGAQILAREAFDLVQVQEPFVCGPAGAYLARRFRLPLVVGLYSDEIDNPAWIAERPLNRVANHVGKWVLRQASAVRTDSAAVAGKLAGHGYSNVTHIPFLITNAGKFLAEEPDAAAMRQRLLAGESGPLLLAVCRLEPEKNVPMMLQGLASALRQRPGLVLAIAGSGSLEHKLRAEAERLAPGRVRWLGWLANTEMHTYFQAADLMVLSSNRESAARVLFESLLSGTPVLTTDTAGAREVIEDGISGRIVPVGNTSAFAGAIAELAGNPQRLTGMGREGRRRIALKVSPEHVVGQLRWLYERALGQVA